MNQDRDIGQQTHRVLFLREADVTFPEWQQEKPEGLGWKVIVALVLVGTVFVITASNS